MAAHPVPPLVRLSVAVTATIVLLAGCVGESRTAVPAAVPVESAAPSGPDCAADVDLIELARCLDAELPPRDVRGGGALGGPEPQTPLDPEAPVIDSMVASGILSNDADGYTVKEYVAYVLELVGTMWSARFTAAGFTGANDVFWLLIEPGFTYTTSCTDEKGNKLGAIPSTYPNVFYCGADTATIAGLAYKGSLVIPLDTMAKVWRGDIVIPGARAEVIGDFGAAMIVAHEFGHHVADQLQIQTGSLKPANLRSQELVADCFAGVWAQEANTQGILDPGDLSEAISAFAAIGHGTRDGSPSTPATYGTGTERAAAVMLGYSGTGAYYRSASMEGCIVTYWNYVP